MSLIPEWSEWPIAACRLKNSIFVAFNCSNSISWAEVKRWIWFQSEVMELVPEWSEWLKCHCHIVIKLTKNNIWKFKSSLYIFPVNTTSFELSASSVSLWPHLKSSLERFIIVSGEESPRSKATKMYNFTPARILIAYSRIQVTLKARHRCTFKDFCRSVST